ncbi:MAG: hypothetical protein RR248_00100 [Clostridia bacterium]
MSENYLSVTNQDATIKGVTNVESIFDKEAIISRQEGQISFKGEGISISKLELEQGLCVISYSALHSINFGKVKKKFSFSLFK